MSKDELKPKQRKFCQEYVKNGNAYQSAIEAGYTENTAKVKACTWLEKVSFKNYIEELLEEIKKADVMDAQEIQKRLTKIGRGQAIEVCIAVESVGDFCSKAKRISKQVVPKDQIKALETLAKIQGLFNENLITNPITLIVNPKYE